ncbi:unnamed protein product [Musa acuminata subsp. malaccensis]|uniref:(wild Malaysian banana) hypothetical protein n=1 Tax=Musa acuminata subsp. malaccensis TaxID=214687 RepID=A0A804IVG2_MUSAM|nr:PREDICTED: lamin-like protein [Musa acuminata subsp. malaccensis]CAG1843787.1 unnamed protein product [Musa acuminata subsp. malaccensis]
MEKSKPTLLLLILVVIFEAAPVAVSAEKFVVGDKQRWAPNVNYTAWSDSHSFHVGDWLVFYYEKGMYDVMEVNATAYEACAADDPIVNWSRGDSFAYQLNRTGRYYFICSRGYCYGGMKVSILAETIPPLAPSPRPQDDSAAVPSAPRRFSAWIAAVSGAVALALVLWFP